MSEHEALPSALDYEYCSYGASRLAFRGPKRGLEGSYVAVLGGSQAFGKFVSVPFADALEAQLGEPVVNLGVMQAGLTLVVDDPAILPIASEARMTVIEVLGAQNMSNRFYSVHPRRNDRFVTASNALKDLFPDVDFTDFHFVGHLLSALKETGSDDFDAVVQELKTAWVRRMQLILSRIRGEKVLLWMADRHPEDEVSLSNALDPHFVDRMMLERLMTGTAGIIEVVPDSLTRSEGLVGKVFLDHQRQAAEAMPGPLFHSHVATKLAEAISDPSQKKRANRRRRAS